MYGVEWMQSGWHLMKVGNNESMHATIILFMLTCLIIQIDYILCSRTDFNGIIIRLIKKNY